MSEHLRRAWGSRIAASEEEPTYKVRVGDDGRWHYTGNVWLDANKTALDLHKRTGRAEIFAYRGDRQIGKRVLKIHPDPIHAERGTPLIEQTGDMR